MGNNGTAKVNYLPSIWERTDSIYVPCGKAIKAMDDGALRRGLCYKSGGNIEACRTCEGCAFGRELSRRCKAWDESSQSKQR